MQTSIRRRFLLALCGLLALGALRIDLLGYVVSGHGWGTTDVVYFVNTNSKWVSGSSAIAAFQQAAGVWDTQTQANVRLVYGGTTSGSSLVLNSKNELFFRDDANGTIAETYFWWDGTGKLVDADMVLHEAGFEFFVGTGCDAGQGIYVEDVAVHEFGHVLGLNHSADPAATMYYSMPSMCDRTQLVLEPDDIAGLEAIYPPSSAVQPPSAPSLSSVVTGGSSPTSTLVLSWSNVSNEDGYRVERSADGSSFTQIAQVGSNVVTYTNTGLAANTTYYYRVRAYNSGGSSSYSNVLSGRTQATVPTNTAPVVTITNPVNTASYPQGAAITFTGSATDTQDGTLTSSLQWSSTIDGNIGTGGSFSRTLSIGTHTIRATVMDSGGLSTTSQVTMTVSGTQGAQTVPTLSVRGYKVKSVMRVDLTWSGSSASSIDVYRSGVRLRTTANDGLDTDTSIKRPGTYTYKICNAGTSACSADASVTF